MKKEIRVIDEKKGIVRVTTADERWYGRLIPEDERVVEQYEWIPSVTWITSYYPKGERYARWIADKGWSEAERIKHEAGDKGSKTHLAIEKFLKGNKVNMDDKFLNHTTGEDEELTVAEYECLLSFVRWFEEVKPEPIAGEMTVFNDKECYAGTLDLICRINGEIWIVDFKTGPNIWPNHKLQVSAYSHAEFDLKKLKIEEEEWNRRKLMILRLGYKRNKKQFKVDEIEDQFDLFLTTREIWKNETKGVEPKQRDYPMYVQMKGGEKDGLQKSGT